MGVSHRWSVDPGGLILRLRPIDFHPTSSTYASHALRYWKVVISLADLRGGQRQPFKAVAKSFNLFNFMHVLNLLIRAEQLLHHTAYREGLDTQRHLAPQFLSQSKLQAIDVWIRENANNKDVGIFSEQQLLTAMCLAISFSRRKGYISLRAAPFEQLGELLLSITDHLEPLRYMIPRIQDVSQESQKRYGVEFILRNGLFNHRDDSRHHLVRHYEIFCEITPNMREHPDFVDLNLLYRKLSGLNLSTFITMGLALLNAFPKVTRDNVQATPTIVQPSSWCPHKDLRRIARKFFREITTTRGRFRRAYQRDLRISSSRAYNFLEIQRHPLLRAGRNQAFCLSRRFLTERFGNGLHHRFLTSRGKAYLDFYGPLFEEYVRQICTRMYPDGRFASRVKYGDNNNKEAADGWIIYPGAAIVLEVKAARFTLETFLSGSFGSFEETFRRAFLHGARQLTRVIQDFKAGLFTVNGFTPAELTAFYPVLITPQYVPMEVFLSQYIRDALQGESLLTDVGIHPLQILHIEDLEHLEGVVAEGTSLLDLLRRREEHEVWKNWPFSNYLIEQFPGGIPQNQHIVAKYRELLSRSAFQLFGQRLHIETGQIASLRSQ